MRYAGGFKLTNKLYDRYKEITNRNKKRPAVNISGAFLFSGL